jgi:hypothetical protein
MAIIPSGVAKLQIAVGRGAKHPRPTHAAARSGGFVHPRLRDMTPAADSITQHFPTRPAARAAPEPRRKLRPVVRNPHQDTLT